MSQLNPNKVIEDLMNHYSNLNRQIGMFEKKATDILREHEHTKGQLKELNEEAATTKSVLINKMLTTEKDLFRNRRYGEKLLKPIRIRAKAETKPRDEGPPRTRPQATPRVVKGGKK